MTSYSCAGAQRACRRWSRPAARWRKTGKISRWAERGRCRRGYLGATLAALPTPLGSFSELFSPPALPGPRGMPLTPASCAKACGAHIKLVAMIKASNPNLTLIHFSPSRLLTAADCCWFRGPGLVVCFATNYRTSEFHVLVWTASHSPRFYGALGVTAR
jgi:hypothetical protein